MTTLSIQNMTITFNDHTEAEEILKGFNLDIAEGETVGVVGESGSGKTTLALAVMGLLKRHAAIEEGGMLFEDQDLTKLDRAELRGIQGNEIAMIFQEPMTALNPTMRIGRQVEEALRVHTTLEPAARKEKAYKALRDAELDPDEVYDKYPHELSGGMRQRAMIAAAIITRPKLLIADEPTTALDVSTQKQILALLKKLNRKYRMAILFISHDLKAVEGLCDRVVVTRYGAIVEQGTVEEIFRAPKAAYTKELLNAYPDKSVTSPDREEPVLTVKDLKAWYEGRQILKGVSFTVYKNEALGLVGESGCGKSTLARCIMGFMKKTEGEIRHYTEYPQMVFQDPYSSLNPARKISWILEEPLRARKNLRGSERLELVRKSLAKVGLDDSFLGRYPDQLSGGQRQRVSIALALIAGSRFIVIDEGLSALDVTIQGQIIRLLEELQKEYSLSYLFISHDLDVVSRICDRVLIMKDGKVLEAGSESGGFHGYFTSENIS